MPVYVSFRLSVAIAGGRVCGLPWRPAFASGASRYRSAYRFTPLSAAAAHGFPCCFAVFYHTTGPTSVRRSYRACRCDLPIVFLIRGLLARRYDPRPSILMVGEFISVRQMGGCRVVGLSGDVRLGRDIPCCIRGVGGSCHFVRRSPVPITACWALHSARWLWRLMARGSPALGPRIDRR